MSQDHNLTLTISEMDDIILESQKISGTIIKHKDKMNHKEKAKDIFNQHYMVLFDSETDASEEILITHLSQKMALISVNLILESSPYSVHHKYYDQDNFDYWQEVKKELKKLKM